MLGPGLMRWAGPLIAPPLFRDACLYLDFTSGVYADAPAGVLSRRRSFEDLVTFTRSGTAERINADLAFETVLAGKPRFMHDPAGVLPRRLAITGSASNANTGSEATSATWALLLASGADLSELILGRFRGLRLSSTGDATGIARMPSGASVTAGGKIVVAFLWRPGTSGNSIRFRFDHFGVASNFVLMTTVGILTPQTTTLGSYALVSHKLLANGCYETIVRWTVNFTGEARAGINHNSPTGGQYVDVFAGQISPGGDWPGWILTDGETVTRAAERAAAPMPHGGGAVTILFDGYVPVVSNEGFPRVFEAVVAATGGFDRQTLLWNTTSGKLRLSLVRGNSTVYAGDLSVGPTGRLRVALSLDDTSVRASVNGGAPEGASGFSGALPSLNELHLLTDVSGFQVSPGNGGVFKAAIFPGAHSDAVLQALSAQP